TGWHERDDVITVAAVQGAAVGAGFQLALACDLRVAASDARFAMRETSLGLVPDLAGTHPLVRAVGYSRALELCATGRWLEAQEALAWGVVSAVGDDLDALVASTVSGLLAAPDASLRSTKRVLRAALDQDAVAQRRTERENQIGLLRGMLGS
ncbi:MAG: enoyl-CoA hydratase/isomerase family protein, partial [Candidatus Nanopelagicales bacterium]